MRRNQFAKLSEHTEFRSGWFGILFYHLCRVAELKSHANHFFSCFNQDSCGMPVNSEEEFKELATAFFQGRMTRRRFIHRAAQLGLSAALVSSIVSTSFAASDNLARIFTRGIQ